MKISESGQITIPREIRDRVGMKPGTEVEISEQNGRLVLTPKSDAKIRMQDWIERVRGTATSGLSTDEIMVITRGEE